jgi:hypothetical protein
MGIILLKPSEKIKCSKSGIVMSVFPATQEVEAGLLEPRSLSSGWVNILSSCLKKKKKLMFSIYSWL